MTKESGWFRERFLTKKRRQQEYASSLPTEDEMQLPDPVDPITRGRNKPRRNDPCPLGKTGPSGKVLKFKQCCGKAGHDRCVEIEKA